MNLVTIRHDLGVNPSPRSGLIYPLLVDLRADVVAGDGRIVAPLTTAVIVPEPHCRALPWVFVDGPG